MFNKLSIRWRMTILSAILLMVCSIGLTVVLNFSAFYMVDTIDATPITEKAMELPPGVSEEYIEVPADLSSSTTQNAKMFFGMQSIIYTIIVIITGSALTYYTTGKALRPLDVLNGQVKNLNVSTLFETLEVPPTKDEIAELTQSFNEMTDTLDNAFTAQKHFSASAAHELRTPLAVLQTKVDVFKKKNIHTDEEYDTLIAVFEKQIYRLRGLVGNLLDMTNLDDKREQSNICLKDMFEEIVLDLSVVAKNKNISITLLCDDSIILGNVELLYRAFYNLIENGIKYNKDFGIVEISVSKMTKEKIRIHIKDSGIGIPEEMKKHIFEPFYRVDKSRSRQMGGVGLGLSIVDNIIKKQGGTIAVLDNDSGGTCFEIIL